MDHACQQTAGAVAQGARSSASRPYAVERARTSAATARESAQGLRIVDYEPWHLRSLRPQAAQLVGQPALMDERNAIGLGQAGPCWSCRDGDLTLGVAGIVDRTPGRGICWALFSDELLGRFGAVHRAAVRFIAGGRYRRLEMTVDPNHTAAVRWALRLGFVKEGRMRSYAPDGRDIDLYAWVRGY